MATREQPWHERIAFHQHARRYSNLRDIAILRDALEKQASSTQSSKKGRPWEAKTITQPALSETLALVAELGTSNEGLPSILDDTSPEDVLGRLEHALWAALAWTVEGAKDPVPLLAVAWEQGVACAHRRRSGGARDMRQLQALFGDSPFGDESARPRALAIRLTSFEGAFELLHCPHRSEYREVDAEADLLCEIQAEWTRGFLHQLEESTTLEYKAGNKKRRCVQTWRLRGGNA